MKLEAIWYGRHWLSRSLVPLSGLYRLVVAGRRWAFRRGWLASVRLPVPVILVGNLTVGGTGKTPLVLWLSDFLRRQGRRPVIILRGYGGSARDWPRGVTAASDPREVGDEAVLRARKSPGPLVAGPYRSVGDFQDQVDRLENDGYAAVPLRQVQDAWYSGSTRRDKATVLSSDGGRQRATT